jgi:adenosylhomocysteine nucleosidase
MNPLIVMALESEGQGLLERKGFDVLYCGVGKVNAAYHLTRTLTRKNAHYSHVINLGSAGSHRFNAGMLVAADRFIQRDMDATGIGFALGETPFDTHPSILSFPPYFSHLPHGICASGDSFLQGNSPLAADIIDMEAYALAKICHMESIPFVCAKYITDGADGAAATDWQTNLKHAAHAFSALL